MIEAIEMAELGEPAHVARRRRLPPAATALSSADEVLVLEGGDVPELADVLGDNGPMDPETAPLGGIGFGIAEPGDVLPIHAGDVQALGQRAQALRGVVARRRTALGQARSERTQLVRRIEILDRLIADVLAPQQKRAAAAGNAAEARRLDRELDRLDLIRGVAAARAIRYAKTEALGQVLTRTARTQHNLAELMIRARARGDRRAEASLQRGFSELARDVERLKTLRQTQVETWKRRTAAGRLALSTVVRENAERDLAALERRPRSAVTARRADERATELRVRIAKLRTVEARQRTLLPGLTTSASAVRMARELTPIDQGEVLASLDGLEGIFGSIKNWAKKAGGALAGGAKKIGGAIVKTTKKIGAAGVKLVKKTACKVASKPELLNAAGTAAGAAYGAPTAGAAGSQVAGALLQGACGTTSPQAIAEATATELGPGPATGGSAAAPIIIGGAAAAAVALLMLAL